jgi:DNA-directed RNA polymerase alpha subunit
MTLLEPTTDLPDDIPLDRVRLPTRIRNVLLSAGVRTIGEVREATDATLTSFPNMGRGSVRWLRDHVSVPGTSP